MTNTQTSEESVSSLWSDFIASPSYRLAFANSQISAYEELIVHCQRLEKAEREAALAKAELLKFEQLNLEELSTRSKLITDRLQDAQKQSADAAGTRQTLESTQQLCKNRFEFLDAGNLSETDTTQISTAADAVNRSFDSAVQSLISRLKLSQHAIENTEKEIGAAESEFQGVKEALVLFSNQEVPSEVELTLQRVSSKAELEHASLVEKSKAKLDELFRTREVFQFEISTLKIQIDNGKVKTREIEVARSGSLFGKLTSANWWGSVFADHSKKMLEATNKKATVEQKLVQLENSISKQNVVYSDLLGAKLTFIEEARVNELGRQHNYYLEKFALIPQELVKKNEILKSENDCKVGIEASISSAYANRLIESEQAKIQELSRIVKKSKLELEQAQKNFVNIQIREKELNNLVESCKDELAALPSQFECSEREKTREQKEKHTIADTKVAKMLSEITRFVTENGLQVENPISLKKVQATLVKLRQTIQDLSADQGIAKSHTIRSNFGTNKTQKHSEASTQRKNSTNSGFDRITGNLYLDFDRNAEDNLDKWGKTYEGLRSQLSGLRKRHSPYMFPGMDVGSDILELFQESFFPGVLNQTYFVSNLSLQDSQPYLAIRPKTIGPRLEQVLPHGMTLAVCVRLHDNRRDPENPVLMVQKIIDLSHSDAREFEREIEVTVISNSANIYPGSLRQQNVVRTEFISSLPAISIETKERLQGWRDYLDWKDRNVQSNALGLRYLSVEINSDVGFRFLVIAESKASFDQSFQAVKKGRERYAFGLKSSNNEWDFQFNSSARVKGTSLGRCTGSEEVNPSIKVDTRGIPWSHPYIANVDFQLGEDALDRCNAMIGAGKTHDEISIFFRKFLPSSGFLALDSSGDSALIKRQRDELKLLQEQSGYSPFLSSYLFDIGSANVPNELVDIEDSQWSSSNINEDQKNAVRKMISAPDLALVQGPPGTGKTTMIAEATWQLVRQGKSVLIVSQANLAVDNALERLKRDPGVRAIRLGRKGDQGSPFSPSRALETYYASIAQHCRERTLNIWSKNDEEHSVLSRWISDCDLLINDISAIKVEEAETTSNLRGVENTLRELSQKEEQRQTLLLEKTSLEEFKKFINNEGEWNGELPDIILESLFHTFILPIDKLNIVGIRINKELADWETGSRSQKSDFILESFRAWRELLNCSEMLNADCQRLKVSNEETLLDSASALRLEELGHSLKRVQHEMLGDKSKVIEWESIQKQLRDLKRQGSGLDRKLYQQVFNGYLNGADSHIRFTDPKAKRIQVLTDLELAVTTILDIGNEVSSGLILTFEAIDQKINEGDIQPTEAANIQSLEAQSRAILNRAKELTDQRKEKESRLIDVMQQQTIEIKSAGSSNENYLNLRHSVLNRLNSIQTQRNQFRSFRDEWTTILQNWTDDLARPSTLLADQTTLLPTYIASCNVVGVTCTESRRTLESNGHTRFDVAIVDEVSKATPTEIIMPLMMSRSAILVGDHRQLPPLFSEQGGSWEEAIVAVEESIQAGENDTNASSELTEENFERFRKMVTSSLFKEHFESASESLKSFLFTQYRMHPDIMNVVNHFYEGKLKLGLIDPDGRMPGSDPRGHRVHGLTLMGARNQKYVKPEQHVIWLDSTLDPSGRKHHERAGGTSKVNDLETILVAKCLFDLEMDCREKGYGLGNKEAKAVGVITFYESQKRAISRAIERIQQIRNFKFQAIQYDVNTVDRYQGQERPIIIVSMVRNPPWKLSAKANTAQFERINVAFSRAQELLIVTGAKDVFCSYPVDLPFMDRPGRRKVEVYRYIIEEIERNAGFWRSDTVIDSEEYSKLMPHDNKPSASVVKQRRARS